MLADRETAGSESGPGTGVDTLSVRGLGDLVQENSEGFVGFPDHHIGADLVGEWYKRNLRIYANIWRAVDEGDQRIVVLIGQGHLWPLRTFFRENPEKKGGTRLSSASGRRGIQRDQGACVSAGRGIALIR